MSSLGAEPLYFLDYLALGTVNPAKVEAIVAGVAAGCCEANAALIGAKQLKCLICMKQMLMTWLVLPWVLLKSQLLTPSNVKKAIS